MCAEAASDDYDPKELVCGGCSDVTAAQVSVGCEGVMGVGCEGVMGVGCEGVMGVGCEGVMGVGCEGSDGCGV